MKVTENCIEFADPLDSWCIRQGCRVTKESYNAIPFVSISDCSDEGMYVFINSEEHAKNLIKALKEAIKLGWLE